MTILNAKVNTEEIEVTIQHAGGMTTYELPRKAFEEWATDCTGTIEMDDKYRYTLDDFYHFAQHTNDGQLLNWLQTYINTSRMRMADIKAHIAMENLVSILGDMPNAIEIIEHATHLAEAAVNKEKSRK